MTSGMRHVMLIGFDNHALYFFRLQRFRGIKSVHLLSLYSWNSSFVFEIRDKPQRVLKMFIFLR